MSANQQLTTNLKYLWQYLSKRRKLQYVALLCLMLISAISEVISLGAVIPFLAVLIEPEMVFTYPIVASSAQLWGIVSADQLVLPLTVVFCLAALAAGAIRMLMMWASTRIAYACASDLSVDVYRRSLYQPYSVHLTRSSSEIISGVTFKVNEVALGVLQALPTLISSFLLLATIFSALVIINPQVAFVAGFGFGLSYVLISFIFRRRLKGYSSCVAYEQTKIVKSLQEGVGSIRDVLLDGTQSVFCDIYRKSDILLRRAQGNSLFVTVSPRYVMEAIGMVLIASLAYYLSSQEGGISAVFPVLGALALGAQRMLPALQQIYSSVAIMQANQVSISAVIDLLDQPLPTHLFSADLPPLEFQKTIKLKNVSFQYEGNGPKVLDDLNLSILKGSRVGVVGTTGSGKSTLLDLLMGLLEPTHGDVLVDEIPLTSLNRQSWMHMIAHVPQKIYLTDTTVAENIAFGVPFDEIDMVRVKCSAQQAQISSFIENRPKGYLSLLGEQGISLSGGQQQRIGIARALYKQASVLVFDEATSALDSETELAVMQAIEGLSHDLTIIIIAHRLTTLKKCTKIIELSDGEIKRIGSYQDIVDQAV